MTTAAHGFRHPAPDDMRPAYSTLDVARRLGVSVQSVQRWVDLGRLRAWKTPGGHRRIDAGDAENLFREFAMHPARPQPSRDAGPVRVVSVLVVDDDPVHRELAIALLQDALPNAAVTGAASGFEALIAVGQQAFDLLVTDVVMPNMNGFEMLRHLAASGRQRPRWLLATSSRSLSELQGLGSLPADVCFFRKPWSVDALGDWLRPRFAA